YSIILRAKVTIAGELCSDPRASRPARVRRTAVVAGQPVQGELQHNFGGARRQGAIARDVLQSPKKTANIDQQPGELGAYCVQCLTYVLPNRDDRFGQRISPIPSAAATNQLDVVRGINCARV